MAKKKRELSDAQYQKMYEKPKNSTKTGSSKKSQSSSSSSGRNKGEMTGSSYSSRTYSTTSKSSSQQANERGRTRTARTNVAKQQSYTPTRTNTVHGRNDSDINRYNRITGTGSSSTAQNSMNRNVGMNRTQGSSSNTDRTSAGTAARAKEAWNRLEEDRKTREAESRARRNQKMTGGVTKADQQKSRQRFATARELLTERAKEAQKQKMGAQVSEEEQTAADRAFRNTPGLAKKAILDTIQGHGKTIADLTELTASNKNGTDALAMKMGIQDDPRRRRELEKQRQETVKKAREDRERWQKQQEKRQAEWDEKTKNAKGLEKAYYGAVESGIGMLTDTALGLGNPGASLVAMGSRTYGSTRGQAQKEGATEREDRIYSLLQAGKEVGTELMFPGVGLARRAYGRAGLPLAEKAANALTRSLRGRTADITRAGLRLLGGTVEENAEEIAGWGLDPLIKEFTYGRNVRRRDAKETMNRVSESIRSNIQSEEDAVAASAYLSSASFLDETKREYMAEGMSEADATEVAQKMRDFLTASLIGDTDTMERLEDEVSKKVAGTKLDWDWKELGETIASTTLLTGVTGLPGAITTAARGAAIRDELGADGVRALANTAIDFEDEKDSYKGQAARDRIDSGAELTSTQVYDLAEAMQKQTETDNKRNVASKTQAIDVIENEKLVIPYGVNQNNGNLEMDDVVADKYESDAREASNTIRSYESTSEGSESLTDTEVRNGSKAIAGFKSGIFTVEDANELNYRNTAVRSAFESETGVNLEQYVVKNKDGTVNVSATNAATKDALFAMASDNLVESARVATVNWMDNVKGEVVTQVTARMGAQGAVAFQAALDDVDERNRSEYMMVANASDMLYQSARNMGTEWDNVKDQATKMFPQIAESKLEAMYNAGLEDRRNANDILRNRSIHIGNALTEVGEQERSPEAGRVYVDTETSPKGTVVRAFSELASNLGVDIHLVDNIETSSGKQANGYYINGAIYINVNSDFEQNMGYIFMHEVTHHLKMIAPEEYAALENLVREKWFEYDDAQMQNEIARKIQSYADAGQTLTEEEALEEIIADAAHEFLNDPNFANQVAEDNPTLAKAILNSIRNALRMLRRVLATGSIDDETHMNNLFSQLDIFDEAEKLWLNAYTAAYQNKAALAIDIWQDEVNERYSTAETNAGERFSITEQQDSDYMSAVESGDMETAQRMVDEVAKQKGYTPRLYHGTSAFGFTEFDLNKMDDKTSIFLTDNEEIASTYSGKPGSKAINERSNLDYANMSMKDIVDSLNGANISVADEAVSYDYYDAGRIEALKLEIDSGLNKLSEIVDSKVTEYAERMAEDFNDTDMKTHKQLVQLKKKLDLYKEVQEGKRKVSNPDGLYIEFSTPTYLLLNNTDAFDNVDYDVKSLEENIRLFDLLNKEMNRGEASKSADNWQNYFDAVRGEGFIVERALDGYHLEYLPRYEAINKLRSAVDAGNYALYAKLENPLVIDADGAYWKSIPVPRELLSSFADDYHSHADGNMVMNFEDGRTVTNTRSLASYAKRAGYDGVILNNLKDHGGLRYDEVPHDLDANIYIAFDPNAVASADPVTYDDNGNVIPLSQRFNIEKPDIRYSISDTMSVLEDNFNEYKEDKTNLRIATEALDDLQRVRYALSESSERDVSGRWDGGVQVRTIAKGISTELVREGYVEFRGQKVESPEDLAKLCQVLRDPRFETFRLILTKNNKIVSFQSISARMPGVSPIHNRETDEDYDKYVLDLVARTKADGFYMLHNHPSGNVSASRPDLMATAKMINLLGSNMFKGHVILDHDKYGLIEDIPQTVAEGWTLPSAREVEIPGQQTLDLIHEPEVDHKLLGERVSSPEAVAQIGAHVNTSDDMSVLVYVGSSGGVRGIQEISNKTLANDEGAKGFIRNQATEFGSSLVFLYKTSDDSSVTKAALNLYKDGILRDVVSSDWSQSFEARGIDQTGDATQQGYSSQELRNRAVVFETASGAKDYSGLKYSITPKMNADYMAAVNSGNMEEAQRLVEEAAKAAGYNEYVFHGTGGEFTEFDESKSGANHGNWSKYGKGFYFSSSEDTANYWGNNRKMIKAYIKLKNPYLIIGLEMTSEGPLLEAFNKLRRRQRLTTREEELDDYMIAYLNEKYGKDYTTNLLKEHGYDGIVVEHPEAEGRYSAAPWSGTIEYIVFDAENIKSADTVTYAEDGSIIPLSERFNPKNKDIRYSLPTTDADGKILSDGQMDYFKNSQARDEQGRLVPVYHSTNRGGFTIFDPSYSDDHRSLFFAASKDISLTYGGLDANRPVDYEGGELQSGYYECYLNLENPMIIDCRGSDWDRIMGDGFESLFVSYRNGDFYVESSDEWLTIDDIRDEYGEGFADAAEAWLDNVSTSDAEIGDLIYTYEGRAFDPEVEGYYPDENDTRTWCLEAEAQGYDGVIFLNIKDIGGNSDGIRLKNEIADVYVAFNSNQVKDVNNLNPTENPDIRYSITPEDEVKSTMAYEDAVDESYEEIARYEAMLDGTSEDFEYTRPIPERRVSAFYAGLTNVDSRVYSDVKLEEDAVRMARSKNDFYNHLNAKWQDRWTTEGEVLDIKSVKTNVRNLVMGVMQNSASDSKYKSDLVKKTLLDMKTAYQLMKQDRTDVASALLYYSAQRMIDNVEFYTDGTFDQYKKLRDYLRTTKISLGEEYWSDVDYDAFRKANFGRLKLVKGTTNVDQVYQELEEMFPEWFNEEENMTIPDQLLQIDHVLDAIQPYKEAYSSEEAASLAFDIADDLYEIMVNGEELTSLADRYKQSYEAKVDAMKQRHAEAMLRMRKARDIGVLRERAKWRAREMAKKEKANHRKHYERIQKNYDWLVQRVLDPTKDKNVPEEFRQSLAEMLQTLDMQTEASKKLEAKTGHVANKTFKMREFKDRLNEMATKKGENGISIFELDENVGFLMDALVKKLDGQSVDALDTRTITEVDKVLAAIRGAMARQNKIRIENKSQEISEIAGGITEDFLSHVDKFGRAKKYEGIRGGMNAINTASLTPVYFFERLGKFNQMYEELRYGGFDTYVRNEKFIIERMKEITKPYYKEGRIRKSRPKPGSKLEEWRDSRSAQTFTLTHGSITLSAAQMMSLYCLSKRPQAMQHMLSMNGGIVATPIDAGSKIEKARERFLGKTETNQKVVVTEADIQTIIEKLTPEQMSVADQLQELMSVDMARLGNEAHREMYGYDVFEDPNYFPIKVHGNEVATDINNLGDVIQKIKSFGPAKPLDPNANNLIEIDDIFSVTADHCNGMNLYNAFLVPISDFMRVYNYKQYFDDGKDAITVKDALEAAHGKRAMDYILNFMKDINGIKPDNRGGLEDVINKALGTAKKTAVFGNIRVALQQPTAIVRALAELDAKYLTPLLNVRPEKGVMEEMWNYCPIAYWKSLGFYDAYMGRDIEDVMMNNWSVADAALSGVYGELDNWTWSLIWRGVKAEQAAAHPEMDTKSEEFLQLCGRRASEVFDKTQVVDSTFHRSDAMRSRQIAIKSLTAFMAEPTLTLNVFRAGWHRATDAWMNGEKGKAAKIFNRALSVIVAQAALVSVAQAVADAWRGKDPDLPWDDDDDDEKNKDRTYMDLLVRNMVANFFDNLHLENNIYLVKDGMPLFNYIMSRAGDYNGWNETFRFIMGWDQEYLYSNSNLIYAGGENIAKGIAEIYKKLEKGDEYIDYNTGEPKSWYDIIQKTASGVGTFTGLPFGTLMRDFKPLLEKAFAFTFAADGSDMDTEISKKITEWTGAGNGKGSDGGKSDGKGSKSSKSSDGSDLTSPDLNVTMDGFMTDAELKQDSKDKLAAVKDKVEGLPSTEKNQAIFDKTNDLFGGYTNLIEKGRFDEIERMRSIIEAAGGNVKDFDAKVLAKSKTAYKKTLGDSMKLEQQWATQDYLKKHGVSDEEISELCYKSYTKSDLVYCWNQGYTEAAEHEMFVLASAGMSVADMEKAYHYRNRQRSYNGKYTDEEYVARWTTLQERKTQSTGKFVWPTDGIITSDFGGRESPGGIGSTNHQGIDIGASTGTPACAADGGEVIMAEWYGGYGNTVQIKHKDGTVTQYSHLNSINCNVGDRVAQGAQVGEVGSTGNSTGAHLHFGVMIDGYYVDPLEYLDASGKEWNLDA